MSSILLNIEGIHFRVALYTSQPPEGAVEHRTKLNKTPIKMRPAREREEVCFELVRPAEASVE